MKRVWLVAVPLVVAAVAVMAVYAQEAPRPAGGVLAGLRVGQNIAMADAGSAVQLTVFAVERPGPFRITELGADYIAIQDLAALNEHRIPLTSIKMLTHVKR